MATNSQIVIDALANQTFVYTLTTTSPNYIKQMYLTGWFIDATSGTFDDLRLELKANGLETLQTAVFVPAATSVAVGGSEIYLVGYGNQRLNVPVPILAKALNQKLTSIRVHVSRWDGSALPTHTHAVFFFNVDSYDPMSDPTSYRRQLGTALNREGGNEF